MIVILNSLKLNQSKDQLLSVLGFLLSLCSSGSSVNAKRQRNDLGHSVALRDQSPEPWEQVLSVMKNYQLQIKKALNQIVTLSEPTRHMALARYRTDSRNNPLSQQSETRR